MTGHAILVAARDLVAFLVRQELLHRVGLLRVAIIQSRTPSHEEYASDPNTSLPTVVGTSSNWEPAV